MTLVNWIHLDGRKGTDHFFVDYSKCFMSSHLWNILEGFFELEIKLFLKIQFQGIIAEIILKLLEVNWSTLSFSEFLIEFFKVIGAQQGRRPSALQFTGGRDVFAQTDRNENSAGQLSVADLDLDNRLQRKFKKLYKNINYSKWLEIFTLCRSEIWLSFSIKFYF